MHRTTRRFSAALCATLLVVACDVQRIDPIVPSATQHVAAAGDYPVFPSERPFVELANQVPGFGGLFFDDEGDLVAYLTDLGRAAALEQALQPIVQAGAANRASQTAPRLVVRRGDYDFLQLRLWRDRLTDPVLSTPGVVYLDLDERRNRVVIAIHDNAARSPLEQAIVARGVPRQAVVITLTGPNTRDSGLASGHTLRELVRPIVGGLQNNFVTSANQVPTNQPHTPMCGR